MEGICRHTIDIQIEDELFWSYSDPDDKNFKNCDTFEDFQKLTTNACIAGSVIGPISARACTRK